MASAVQPLNAQSQPAGTEGGKPAASTPPPDTLANKETFLKLLVAELKYQNPLSPADGLQFLTQLSRFSELEQVMGMRQELGAIREAVDAGTEKKGG